jgi:8-oxo-dGTP pyrophosphatase MutT (NUDIX family)
MCDPNAGIMPKHAQRMSAEELQQSLDGWVFSLGWWDASSEMVPEEGSEAALLESLEETGITKASSNATSPEDRKGVLRRRVFGVDAGRAHAYNFRQGDQ